MGETVHVNYCPTQVHTNCFHAFSEENLEHCICQISNGIPHAVNCVDRFHLSKYIWHNSWNWCWHLLKFTVVYCHRRSIWFSISARKIEEGNAGFTTPASFKSLSGGANPCNSSQEAVLFLICSLGWGWGIFRGFHLVLPTIMPPQIMEPTQQLEFFQL